MGIEDIREEKIGKILKHVENYLEARFEQAGRINPHILNISQDIIWQEKSHLREIMLEGKAFGPERYPVIDIITGDDDSRRKTIFVIVGQNSICHEIINAESSAAESTGTVLNIKDVRTLYIHIDPSFEKVVELVQIWIWWDLFDATDLVVFDLQSEHIRHILRTQLTDELKEKYRVEMKKPKDDFPTKTEIINLEIMKIKRTLERMGMRRKLEPGYEMIIKRDKQDIQTDELILKLSDSIRQIQEIQKKGSLDNEKKSYYASILGITPDAVTLDRVKDYLNEMKNYNRKQLLESVTTNQVLSEPYNLKEQQYEDMKQRMKELIEEIKRGSAASSKS